MGAVTLNFRIVGELADYINNKVRPGGRYEDVGEYVRDLVRRELERDQAADFEELRVELQRAFAVPDEDYRAWNAEAFLADLKSR